VWRGADDVPHSGILPPYEAGWWPDPASFCRRVSCQVADITSHVKHTTTTTTVLNILEECLFALWSDFRQVILNTAVDQ